MDKDSVCHDSQTDYDPEMKVVRLVNDYGCGRSLVRMVNNSGGSEVGGENGERLWRGGGSEAPLDERIGE